MTDVRLYHTLDGGGINVANGQPEMADGLETACYLSLFGGNVRDAGLESERSQEWWGNKGEPDPSRQQRSETQHLLTALPAIPANLKRVEGAALRDLAWLTEEVADNVAVTARMPALNTISIQVDVLINGVTSSFAYSQPWRNS
jgi:phage gp46-like protein